ncbi:hypothetical protein F4861DRAFT_482569 [Xylaria intraflava]|nr:hypothetical protein F4861DRAFT_482569 [Xylaria intraflava]
MLTPASIPYISFIDAFSHTPAVSITRSLPHGVNADILLLGCGDVRNILYTAYTDLGLPPRKLDITCCDVEPAIIARNVLLFSLLADGVDADAAMDIYFHLYITPSSHNIITRQARKLVRAMSSLDEWQRSPYGSLLHFCDQGSLSLVEPIVQKYAAAEAGSRSKGALSKHLERSQHLAYAVTGHYSTEGAALIGVRSAAPLARPALQYLPLCYHHFWKHGTFLGNPSPLDNPLYTDTLSENVALHYSANPTLGFHLATAFARLAPASPLRVEDTVEKGLQRTIEAARVQFHAWAAAYKEISKSRIVLRFAVADALTFSHTLQCTLTGSGPSANMPRGQQHPYPLVLNPSAYGPDGYAPSSFDIIDTSNLSDRIGALNLLVAASPLLKDASQSTLYLEALVEMRTNPKAQFDTLLQGHAPSILLFLGLAPVEYWTGATIVSTTDELYYSGCFLKGEPLRHQSRFSFKLASHFLQQEPWLGRFSLDPESLAVALCTVYDHMFQHEDALSTEKPQLKMSTSGTPAYRRDGFVAVVKSMQANVTTDWPSFWQHLLRLIQQGARGSPVSNLYLQELRAQLHIQGLYTEPWLRPRAHPTATFRGPGSWKGIPEVVCVTLVVPRDHVNQLYSTDRSKVTAPVLEGTITYNDSTSDSQSRFSSAQIVFGTVERQGSSHDEPATLNIKSDLKGWQGDSAMNVSFYVPTNVLFLDPDHTQIGLGVQQSISNAEIFQHLGEHTMVFGTPLSNDSNVILSKFLPGTIGYPITCGRLDIGQTEDLHETVHSSAGIKTSLALDRDRVLSLCCHVDFVDEEINKLLTDKAPIILRQSLPTVIEIVFGKDTLVYPVTFPVPVSKETAKTRIARKSSYIEIIAPFAESTASTALEFSLFPIALRPDAIPVIINGDYVNLESLPILSVEASDKRNNQWMTTLTSNQFSLREREIRNRNEELDQSEDRWLQRIDKSLRVNLKDSIFTMFMLSAGLQGGQTGLFSLSHPTEGNCVLIFVRTIRLHAAAASIVADAACLPLTRELLQSNVLDTFLLVLRELQICSITVDDEELALWKMVLPFMVERCRTWVHKPSCEYKQPGATIPLSMRKGDAFMCSCGNGVLPENYMSLPEWDEASKHMVRLAISPIFVPPILESTIDPAMSFPSVEDLGMGGLQLEKCWVCNATEASSGKKLLKCSRCREALYCSAECQKRDWRTHRMECLPSDAHP